MSNKPTHRVRVSVFIAVAVVTGLMMLANRQERASPALRQDMEEARRKAEIDRWVRSKAALPQVDFASAELSAESQSSARKIRSKLHNIGHMTFKQMREDTTEVTREEESFLPLEPLPAATCDAVVVGSIVDAKAYLSEDRSAAYSEYSLAVTDVLKGAAELAGSRITLERIGGKVLLAKKRAILFWDGNKGTPEIGHRYVLFLRYDRDAEYYPIVTGYELSDGGVIALDRPDEYAVFAGSQETAFLDVVRSRIK